jgi:hypothetical protein
LIDSERAQTVMREGSRLADAIERQRTLEQTFEDNLGLD